MTPEHAQFLLHFLLPQLESEQSITQKIFTVVPREKQDYAPAPKSKTAFEIARHIAITESWLLDAVIRGGFEEIAPLPAAVDTCQRIAAWYAENFRRRVPMLRELSGGHLATPVDFLGLRQDPAVCYLNIAIRHSVHHRGQLSAYLRPMGAKVPAIYVESADEPYPAEEGSPSSAPPPCF